jgi:hypothetical protein
MTNAQIVALGIRLFCIWLVIYLLQQAQWALSSRAFQEPGAAPAIVTISVVFLAILVVLWFFPLAVVRKLLPSPTLDAPTSLPIDQLQRAGFCLLGLWILTEAVPKLIQGCLAITRPGQIPRLPSTHITTPYS